MNDENKSMLSDEQEHVDDSANNSEGSWERAIQAEIENSKRNSGYVPRSRRERQYQYFRLV